MSYDLPTASQRPCPAVHVAVRYMLDADVAPGLLPRLMQPFAKRDLIPDRMWSHRSGETLHVEIAVEAMPAEMLHLVEGNLRQVVGVRSVTQLRRDSLRHAA
jgi:hypothetical protein